jgi:membrane protein YqaA with SNARE-associated domain
MNELWAFLGLFSISFLSATILPLQSEVVLLGMLYFGYNPLSCLLIATLGNVLGGTTNYFLGLWGNALFIRKKPSFIDKIQKHKSYIDKYGSFLAFFSWLPIIGDPLLIAMGFFKINFWVVFLLMSLGKFIRYLLITLSFL